jgi:hypothetical protein
MSVYPQHCYGLKCLDCGTTVVSFYQYDFKSCKCGKVFIDAFGERMGWTPGQPWEWVDLNSPVYDYLEGTHNAIGFMSLLSFSPGGVLSQASIWSGYPVEEKLLVAWNDGWKFLGREIEDLPKNRKPEVYVDFA